MWQWRHMSLVRYHSTHVCQRVFSPRANTSTHKCTSGLLSTTICLSSRPAPLLGMTLRFCLISFPMCCVPVPWAIGEECILFPITLKISSSVSYVSHTFFQWSDRTRAADPYARLKAACWRAQSLRSQGVSSPQCLVLWESQCQVVRALSRAWHIKDSFRPTGRRPFSDDCKDVWLLIAITGTFIG